MLENLVGYYKKKEGVIKKILACIFSQKLVLGKPIVISLDR